MFGSRESEYVDLIQYAGSVYYVLYSIIYNTVLYLYFVLAYPADENFYHGYPQSIHNPLRISSIELRNTAWLVRRCVPTRCA